MSLPSSHPHTAYLRSAASRHTRCAAQRTHLRLRGGGTDGTGGAGGGPDNGAPQRTCSLDNMLSGISAKSQEFASGVSKFPSFLLNGTANSKPTAPAPGADAPAAVNKKLPLPPPPPPKDGEVTSADSQMRKKKRKSWPVRQRLWASFTDVFHALAALEQAPGTLMKSKADDKAEFIRSLWRGMMPVMSYACCSIYMVNMCCWRLLLVFVLE